MSAAKEYMEAIRQKAETDRQKLGNRFKVSARYKIRKAVRNLPTTALGVGIGLINIPFPVVGDLVGAAADAVVDAIKGDRLKGKLDKYKVNLLADYSFQDIYKHAKHEIKDLRGLVDSLDGNRLKLQDARTAFSKVSKTFDATNTKSGMEEALKAHAEEYCYRLYRVRHYENKLAFRSLQLRELADKVTALVEKSAEGSGDMELTMLSMLESCMFAEPASPSAAASGSEFDEIEL